MGKGPGRPPQGHESHKTRSESACPACRMRRAREGLEYDRAQMGKALGVHERTVQRWELEEQPVPVMALGLVERLVLEKKP